MVLTILKNISQWDWLSHILWKKNMFETTNQNSSRQPLTQLVATVLKIRTELGSAAKKNRWIIPLPLILKTPLWTPMNRSNTKPMFQMGGDLLLVGLFTLWLCQNSYWKISIFFMGQSTISKWQFSIVFCMFTRGYPIHIPFISHSYPI